MKLRSLTAAGIASIAVALLSVAMATTAEASPAEDLQTKVDSLLVEYPGGEQISENEIAWDDGATILALIDTNEAGAFAVGSCPSGSFCAYSYAGYVGSRITFTSCTASNSVAPLGSVRSIANSRSSGSIYGYNGSSVSVTVGANSGTNTTAALTRLGC